MAHDVGPHAGTAVPPPSDSPGPAPVWDAKVPLEVSLAEYTALRSEITQRIASRATIIAGGLTGIGVILAVRTDLMVWVSPVAFLVCVLHESNAYWGKVLSKYIREELWPRMSPKAPPEHRWRWSWEHYNFTDPARLITVPGFMAFLAECAAPGLCVLASIYSILSSVEAAGPNPDATFQAQLVINWTLTLLMVVVSAVFQNSHRIPRTPSRRPKS